MEKFWIYPIKMAQGKSIGIYFILFLATLFETQANAIETRGELFFKIIIFIIILQEIIT